MARSFAVKAVHKQMYPATYNFRDEPDGTSGTDIDFIDSGADVSHCIIEASYEGHRKVMSYFDDDTYSAAVHHMTQATSGVREWWVAVNDNTLSTRIYFTEDTTLCTHLRFTATEIQDDDGVKLADLTNATWVHLKLEWFADNTFDVWIDGSQEINGQALDDNQVSGINYVQFLAYGNDASKKLYIDAWGDPDNDTDYAVGDNVHWRHYFDQDSDFESEDVGTTGSSIDWVDTDSSGANCEASIIAEYGVHKKVLQLYDNNAATRIDVINTFASGQTTGTIEYWIKNDGGGLVHVYFRDGATVCFYVTMHDTANNWGYLNAAWAFTAFAASPTWVADTWYHVKIIFSCTTDTYDIYINNVLAEAGVAFRAVATTIDDMSIQTDNADSGYYVYLDAISFSWNNDIGDNRTFDYNDTYTKEDITTDIGNVLYQNTLGKWRTAEMFAKTSYSSTTVFVQVYDCNSKLAIEGELSKRDQVGLLYKYWIRDKNQDDLEHESSNSFDADDIHDPTDSTSMLKTILPNLDHSEGDLILVNADTKTDTYSPITKNYPDYKALDDIGDLADSVVIIEADGKCHLDDDLASGTELDLDVAADKAKMTDSPLISDILDTINYFEVRGAINPDTGERWYKITDNTGDDKKRSWRYTNNAFKSQADVDAFTAKLVSKAIPVRNITFWAQDIGCHDMGTTIKYDFVNAVYNVPEGNYYVIFEGIDFDKNKNTIILSEGLIEDSKYSSEFERAEDETDQQGSYVYDRYGAYHYSATDEDELVAAIAAIGNNYGTIRIVGAITLTGQVAITGTGSYVIEGDGIGSEIVCGGDNEAFDVTGACNVTFRNFKIDGTDLTDLVTPTIEINNAACNALCDDLELVGDGSHGMGIYIKASGISKIRDCKVSSFYHGVYFGDSRGIASNNTVSSCGNIGINIYVTSRVIATGNVCYSNVQGILCSSDYCTISGNNCCDNTFYQIYLSSGAANNVVTGNNCSVNTLNNADNNVGIYCAGDYNNITGNVCNENTNAGAGTGRGIWLIAGADNNAVVGNTCKNNDTNLTDAGAGNTVASNET